MKTEAEEAMQCLQLALAEARRERDDYHNKACDIADQRDAARKEVDSAREETRQARVAAELGHRNWKKAEAERDAARASEARMRKALCALLKAIRELNKDGHTLEEVLAAAERAAEATIALDTCQKAE